MEARLEIPMDGVLQQAANGILQNPPRNSNCKSLMARHLQSQARARAPFGTIGPADGFFFGREESEIFSSRIGLTHHR
jgi:hypothetical protein